ncbi:glycoside hydrolase family 13 protein [Ligilactobacillus apodemi]|uniref:Neopullulanase cyclomaltodextrinase maltogenic alpha-amylase n=1 Tax=Ligilactobacillus apodemi DSM 16634 = JCM 16172 TaxID=1423724 RepID=A0A0R1TY89_9LACO|nr:glycoside hydrolase family 13 protein [Ligilactobacillus apodemi]KRL86217.1 neopullulanase cyclomaltodextrinase maltogenic alpha-amylase [Ligilactobacillus apodemi DSM 16634 = JCM 16172]MCR1902043.1 glycoside hydrolase family 13 protein [Ligilactobacillus apodemi]
MEVSAVYHRPDSEMAYLGENGAFEIRLKVKHDDIAKVELLYGDPYGKKANEKDAGAWEYATVVMDKAYVTKYHDYYIAKVKVKLNRLQYAFKLTDKKGVRWLYDDRKIVLADPNSLATLTGFRMPYLHEIDRIDPPEWVKETVWYQIFPERFANGDPKNDPEDVLPWDSQAPTRQNFFGGDLQGIIDKLDYLVDLGINGLYLCPIFTAHSNHKYDTIDYFEIDPHFGDKKTFKRLVDEAHKRGMRIMLDAVFNHLGDFSMQWQDVMTYGRESRFASWFHINEFPVSYTKTDNDEVANDLTYEVFANTPHMPKLNTASREVQNYLYEIATYWIKQFDIDAWRLDVANEIDHHFWRQFYSLTHHLKQDFYVLGEVWHNAQSWVNEHEFDGAMNYPFTETLSDGLIFKNISLSDMVSRLNEQLMLYRTPTNQVMLNSMDTHDTARLLTLCEGNKELARLVLTMMFLQIGAPCIYYGTEIGMTGGLDPACRACMIWETDRQDQNMLSFMKSLIELRKTEQHILSYGTYTWEVDDEKRWCKLVRKEGNATVSAYFNLGKTAHTCPQEGKLLLAQNLTEDKLAQNGFAIFRS